MIHPTHLRIGNIVSLLDEEDYNIIESFDNNELRLKGQFNEFIGYDEIEAIPISEELLLKLGAVKISETRYFLNSLHIVFTGGIWIDDSIGIELQGLHHLQNVYYFRNNEELNIDGLWGRFYN